jgi:hypothetical protein
MESTSSFEGGPTWPPLLQSHPKTLSELIHSPSHKDNIMEIPSNSAKIYFHFNRLLGSSTKSLRALKECQEGCQFLWNPLKLYRK